MRVELYEIDHGDCPYLSDRNWVTQTFRTSDLPAAVYEHLVADGWRRSGRAFYQNHCPGCSLCIPIRIDAQEFVATKSQRRCLRRNADVAVTTQAPSGEQEVFELYARYCAYRHGSAVTRRQYDGFVGVSPVTTRLMTYRVADRLVGAGWVDELPDGLSSVYFAFDPDESRRSLGTYSILKEIEALRCAGKRWLYLGFYVPTSQSMEYKARFGPHEMLIDGAWTIGTEELRQNLRRRVEPAPNRNGSQANTSPKAADRSVKL